MGFRKIIFPAFMTLLFCLALASEARAIYWFYDYDPAKVYRLYGEVDLIYQRNWSDEGQAVNRFTDSYLLGLKGFVSDPRVMTFDVKGSFTNNTYSNRDTLNRYYFSSEVSLLNQQVRRGILQYMPQPVRLRFSYFKTEDSETFLYGGSLSYHRPGYIRLFQGGKIIDYSEPKKASAAPNGNGNNGSNDSSGGGIFGGKGLYFSFPRMYLDYDTSDYSSDNSSTKTEFLTFRGESHSEHGIYLLDYRYQKYSGVIDYAYRSLDLNADFKFMGSDRMSWLDSNNALQFRDTDGAQAVHAISSNVWQKVFNARNRDTLMVVGQGSVFSSDTYTAYNVNASSTYAKLLTDRMYNSLYGTVSYLNDDTGQSLLSEGIINSFVYTISPAMTFSNRAKLGYTSDGPAYGVGVQLSLIKRIYSSVGYDIDVINEEDGSRTDHLFSLNFSGVLGRNLSFTSRNTYSIISGPASFSEKKLDLNGDLYWVFASIRFSLGMRYLSLDTSGAPWEEADSRMSIHGSASGKRTTTAVRLTASRFFERRKLGITVSSSYLWNNEGSKFYSLYPVLTWNYRQVSLSVEYELIKVDDNAGKRTDQRVFLRLTRKIDAVISPFLGGS